MFFLSPERLLLAIAALFPATAYSAPWFTGVIQSHLPHELTAPELEKLRDIAYQAAREGDIPTLQAYLKVGRPINETNSRGDTLLIVAAYNRQEKAVEILLDCRGIAIDARNRMGLTALTAAAFKGDVPIAKRLIKAGADINAASPSGQTSLMFAAMTGREAIVDLLLEHGANPKLTDKQGNSALSLAKTQEATKVVEKLEAALRK